MDKKILVLGSVNMDLVASVAEMPKPVKRLPAISFLPIQEAKEQTRQLLELAMAALEREGVLRSS